MHASCRCHVRHTPSAPASGSCLTRARPHASDCMRLVVAVLPARGVVPSVEHCGLEVLSAFANTNLLHPLRGLHTFKVTHLASHDGVWAMSLICLGAGYPCPVSTLIPHWTTHLLSCSCRPDRDTSASSVSWKAALRLWLSSVRVMFSHHGTDHWDARVHVAKRQLVQGLCFSSCLKPNPQDRHLGLPVQDVACIPTRNPAWSSSLPKNQPTHALQ